jgi:hypothetical protein
LGYHGFVPDYNQSEAKASDRLHSREAPVEPIDPSATANVAKGGHEDAFPRPRLSARCRFSQGTFAGMQATGETRRFRAFV